MEYLLIVYTAAVILINCHKVYFYTYIFILMNSYWVSVFLFSPEKFTSIERLHFSQIWQIRGRMPQFSNILVKGFCFSYPICCL